MLFFILTLGAAICFACSNVLEKSGIAHIAQNVSIRTPIKFIKSVLTNPKWWLGMGCSGLASIGYYVAMAKYDLSLVQPMMVLNPVLTALFGYWFLKEHLTKRIVCAIACVFTGLLLSARNMGENTGSQSLTNLWIFAGIVIAVALIFKFSQKSLEASDSLIMGAGFGLSAAFYKSLSIDFMLDDLTADTVFGLLLDARTFAYVIIHTVAFAFSQIAFTRGRALFIIPFSAAIGAALPILAGAFVFGENFPTNKIASVAFVLVGAFLFVVKKRKVGKPI